MPPLRKKHSHIYILSNPCSMPKDTLFLRKRIYELPCSMQANGAEALLGNHWTHNSHSVGERETGRQHQQKKTWGELCIVVSPVWVRNSRESIDFLLETDAKNVWFLDLKIQYSYLKSWTQRKILNIRYIRKSTGNHYLSSRLGYRNKETLMYTTAWMPRYLHSNPRVGVNLPSHVYTFHPYCL